MYFHYYEHAELTIKRWVLNVKWHDMIITFCYNDILA